MTVWLFLPPYLPTPPPWVSPLLLHEYSNYSTSNTWCGWDFPHQALSATPTGCSSISLHTLPGDGIRSYRWRAQSHKIALACFRCQSQVVGLQMSHNFCPTWPQVSSSHQVTKVLELQHQSFQWILRMVCVCTLSCFSCIRLFSTLQALDPQAPLSMGIL